MQYFLCIYNYQLRLKPVLGSGYPQPAYGCVCSPGVVDLILITQPTKVPTLFVNELSIHRMFESGIEIWLILVEKYHS